MENKTALFARVVIGASIIASAWIISNALVRVVRIKHQDHVISVTGSAKRRIRSDLIVWSATVSSRASEPAAAYRKLAEDMPKVSDFIKQKGVPVDQIVVGAVTSTELHGRDKDGHELPEQVVAYALEQTVEVTSSDVDRVSQVSREATGLMGTGILIQSQPPKYLYTKLAELKVQMLAEASKDARMRADQMASNAGGKVAGLSSARMGVMQVNAAHDSEVSATGVNDTSSLDKDILAIVAAAFSIE